ncbi:MAG: hypothetical protein HON90_03775 [Halobacteriovoraceae bacterium]|nr:hypothetical protein [Halobacteriovoraceae bacterium]
MISPLRNIQSISDYFKDINNKLCVQDSFRASFFTGCGAREKSYPQIFYLSEDADYVNVGDITIRCDENMNTNYYANKFKTTNRQFELSKNVKDTNLLFSGFFSQEEIIAGITGTPDEFSLDLRSIDIENNDHLDLKARMNISAGTFGSNFEFDVYVKRSDEVTWTEYTSLSDETGKKIINLSFDLSLSSNTSDNYFSIKIYPLELSSDDQYSIFAAPSVLTNENNIYTIASSVGSYEGGSFVALNPHDTYPYTDNRSCQEGSLVYPSSPHLDEASLSGDATDYNSESNFSMSCATIDVGGPPSGGMGSFLLGFICLFMLLNINNISHNFLSKS